MVRDDELGKGITAFQYNMTTVLSDYVKTDFCESAYCLSA